MVTILNPNDPITPDQLADMEKRLGVTLPDDYREFLLTYNGGRPVEKVFDFLRNGQEDGSWIGRFQGVTEKHGPNLEQVHHNTQSFVAPHFFFIATDAGKNSLYLSLGTDDYGAVYFADTDEIDENGVAAMYFVAPSFTAFMDSLYE